MGALDCVSSGDRMKSTESTEVFTISTDLAASNTCLEKQRRDPESQSTESDPSLRRHSLWWTLGTDVPLLIVVGVLIGLFELGVIPSHKAGFFCNDPALSYRFRGDTASTIFVILSIILFPLLIILVSELVFVNSKYTNRTRSNQAIKNTLWLYRSYAYGLFMNLGLVEAMKGLTGSPRPTFFDICEPDTAKTCQGSVFVPTFQCTSTRFSEWLQSDASHSFPSGHTSLSVYCGLFVAWYLQKRAFDWQHRTVFFIPVVQLACLTYAAFCSLTRITDHRHHWWDVLAGVGVGVVSAFYAVLVLCDNFSYATRKLSNDVMSEDSQQSRTLIYDRQTQRTII